MLIYTLSQLDSPPPPSPVVQFVLFQKQHGYHQHHMQLHILLIFTQIQTILSHQKPHNRTECITKVPHFVSPDILSTSRSATTKLILVHEAQIKYISLHDLSQQIQVKLQSYIQATEVCSGSESHWVHQININTSYGMMHYHQHFFTIIVIPSQVQFLTQHHRQPEMRLQMVDCQHSLVEAQQFFNL